MKVYTFSEDRVLARLGVDETVVRKVCERLAAGVDSAALVVALYCTNTLWAEWHGAAWTIDLAPEDFHIGSECGRWRCVERFQPPDLPSRYRLIRLKFGLPHRPEEGGGLEYPLRYSDSYGWEWQVPGIRCHLALLFGHELAHLQNTREGSGGSSFRREFMANQWALDKARSAGFDLEGRPHREGRLEKRKRPDRIPDNARRPESVAKVRQVASRLSLRDLEEVRDWLGRRREELLAMPSRQRLDAHLRRMRSLDVGGWVRVRFDPAGRYAGRSAVVVKKPAPNSEYLEVRMGGDGRRWKWPMAYVRPCSGEE